MKDLLFATTNRGKLAELMALAEGLNIRILSLNDVEPIEVVEDAPTFAENAEKKARAYFNALGIAVIGDDTGLCVDALNGAPGVFSARYGGIAEGVLDDAAARYAANNRRLLKELEGVPEKKRTAHFQTSICFLDSKIGVQRFEGRVDGIILTECRGTNGFGYDPLFFVPEIQKTLSEISRSEKNALSHRARAFAKLKPVLTAWALDKLCQED